MNTHIPSLNNFQMAFSSNRDFFCPPKGYFFAKFYGKNLFNDFKVDPELRRREGKLSSKMGENTRGCVGYKICNL